MHLHMNIALKDILAWKLKWRGDSEYQGQIHHVLTVQVVVFFFPLHILGAPYALMLRHLHSGILDLIPGELLLFVFGLQSHMWYSPMSGGNITLNE